MGRDERIHFFRAITDTPLHRSGVTQTDLVFGIDPRLSTSKYGRRLSQRAKLVRECPKLVGKITGKSQITSCLRTRNVEIINEIENLRRLGPGSSVLIYREKEGCQKYGLLPESKNVVEILLPR